MSVARRIVAVQTTVILTLVYFTAMLPLLLILTFAADALGRTPRRRTMWRVKEKNSTVLSDMQTQY
jgi:uncharacterized membrane protein YsdA (DUF1294 family)